MSGFEKGVPNRRFLFLLASARRNGNSEQLARRAAAQLPVHFEQQWVRLAHRPLDQFVDIRHEGDGAYPEPEGDALDLLQKTVAATDLVFVAPLYWYGLPSNAKLYLDHWSAWLRIATMDFRARMAGKTVWAISVYSDSDPSLAEPLFGTLRLTSNYMNMGWGGALLGEGNRPGDVLSDETAIDGADKFFAAAIAGSPAVDLSRTKVARSSAMVGRR